MGQEFGPPGDNVPMLPIDQEDLKSASSDCVAWGRSHLTHFQQVSAGCQLEPQLGLSAGQPTEVSLQVVGASLTAIPLSRSDFLCGGSGVIGELLRLQAEGPMPWTTWLEKASASHWLHMA